MPSALFLKIYLWVGRHLLLPGSRAHLTVSGLADTWLPVPSSRHRVGRRGCEAVPKCRSRLKGGGTGAICGNCNYRGSCVGWLRPQVQGRHRSQEKD